MILRSLLFVPGNKASMLEKALGLKPDAFVPVKGKWGEQGATNVILRHATVPAVRDALASAYEVGMLKTAKGGRTRKAPGRH